MTDEQPKKKSLSTQELLSMNMDRLKEYMHKWGVEADGGKTKDVDLKRKSQRLVAASPGRDILVLMHDPLKLAQINGVNDRLGEGKKYRISRCQGFALAMETLLDADPRLIVVDDAAEKAEEGRVDVSGLEFILVLKGVMPKDDNMFLLKKQAFLKEFVPGDGPEEKMTNLKLIRKDCGGKPFIYLSSSIDSREAATASRIHNVKSVPSDPPDFEVLFQKLSEVLLAK